MYNSETHGAGLYVRHLNTCTLRAYFKSSLIPHAPQPFIGLFLENLLPGQHLQG